MDGTWLNDHQDYDRELYQKELTLMQERDVKFVIASGNQFENLRTRFPKTADDLYYVAENGVLVAKGRQVLHVESLSDQEVQKMLKIASSYSYPVVVAGLASAYIREQDGTKYYNEMKKYFEKLTVVKSLSEIKDKIFKISLTVPVDVMPELLAKLVKNILNLRLFLELQIQLICNKKA